MIAADIGASSGKMAAAIYDGRQMHINEYWDFPNRPADIGTALYWDVFGLYHSILDGLAVFREKYGQAETFAVDTWGASYGLLDRYGRLLEPVYHYRDGRTAGTMEDMKQVMDEWELFLLTGCQCNSTYTLPQLYSCVVQKSRILESAEDLLFLPDLLSYFLGGQISCEMTIAGTSCLLENRQEDWSLEVMKQFGLPEKMLPPIVEPGTMKGRLGAWAVEKTGMQDTRIIAAVGHDSAAAVAAIPEFGKDALYISVGTSISMGIEREHCLLTREAFEKGFKNTGGIDRRKIIYRDFSASWHINEFLRTKREGGKDYTHPDLIWLAQNTPSPRVYIDVEDGLLNTAGGDACAKMNDYLRRTGQRLLETDGEFIRCIYESIAMKVRYYAYAFRELKEDFRRVYVINGGSRNGLLMQFISDALNMEICAGMPYATISGNLLTQLYARGEVASVEQMRQLSKESFELKVYEPQQGAQWKEEFARYITLRSSQSIIH